MIYADDDVANQVDEMFVEPPEANVETDEDSADEDEGGMFHNLTGRQLRAPVEIKLLNNERVGGNYDDLADQQQNASSMAVDESSPSAPPSADRAQQPVVEDEWINQHLEKKMESMWTDGDLQAGFRFFPTAVYQRFENMSCVEIFETFFDSEVVQYLLDETKKYAQFKNQPDPKITKSEIKCFLAILILSGYNNLPSKRMYWDVNDDAKNILVSKSMRRNRFLQIQRFIHFADNTLMNPYDKAWKIRPIMDKIKNRCLHNFIPTQNLDFDESMIKYFGRHGCKQFIRGKPIRFGYKMWCLNSTEGYLINFDLYQGKNPRGNEQHEILFGKCAAPLVQMIQELENSSLPYNFHLDNLFTGLNLFSYLRYKGFGAIGTIRENRIPKSCPLTNKKIFQKNKRGESQHILDKTSGVLLLRWLDNSVVTMASTCAGVQPMTKVTRYSQAEKTNILVNRPNCISQYNHNMGGTDLMDECVANYRIGVRSKKWYWPIFTWLLDVTINNAWLLYRKTHEKTSNLDFRREIVRTYLARYGAPSKSPGPARTSIPHTLLNSIRYDGLHHYVSSCNRRRCAGTGCKTFGRTMCSKCDVGLCVSCFASYHTFE